MRQVLFVVPVALVLIALVGGACGGSASETPWPVEPDSSQLAPVAEREKPASITAPDGGTKAALPTAP